MNSAPQVKHVLARRFAQEGESMIPQKLEEGDRICVIAPSRSMGIISDEVKNIAVSNLRGMGIDVAFGKNVHENDEYNSSSISSRLEDLHAAFLDKAIKGILTVIGGYNSNQLINKIDYDLIKANPKIFCGFSDITALSNAIYAKTGLVTYYGPHFSSFGMKKGLEYTIDYFQKCFLTDQPYNLEPSALWSDDVWYENQEKRNFFQNDGYYIINQGKVEGTLIGGNLCTFNLLQGTPYLPELSNTIIMMEEDNLVGDASLEEFDRNLQSVIECNDFNKVGGIIIGRFEVDSKISRGQIEKIIKNKKELAGIPVIANVDFGHTTPIVTLPIGGKVIIDTSRESVIEVLDH